VLFRRPGSERFELLGRGQQIPFGSMIDVTGGEVLITTASDRRGGTQSARFWDGTFLITQEPSSRPVTELRLAQASSSAARRCNDVYPNERRRHRNCLWGRGEGRFRTNGRHGAVGVRGTSWLTRDSCDGTLVHVAEGSVTVDDLVRRRSVVVNQGNSYLAAAPRSECDGQEAGGRLPRTGLNVLSGVALASLLLVSGATVVTWTQSYRTVTRRLD
jgi:hypothetical protein